MDEQMITTVGRLEEPFRSLAIRREKQMPSIKEHGGKLDDPRPGELIHAFRWADSPEDRHMWYSLDENRPPRDRHFEICKQREIEQYKLHWLACVDLSPIGGSLQEAYLGGCNIPGMEGLHKEDLSYNIIAYKEGQWYGRVEYDIVSIMEYIPNPDTLTLSYN